MERQNKLKDSLLTFLHNLFDLMIINWLFFLCSLPVITVGIAACGAYRVTLKLARGEAVSPAKDFFRGCRENLLPGFLLGLAALILAVVAAGDIWFALAQAGFLRNLYLIIGVIISVIFLIVVSYTFALQAMFRNPLKTQIANAFKLAVVAPGKTLLLWLILLIPVLFALVLPPVAVGMLGFLYLVVGFSGPMYGASYILRDVFDRVNGSPVVEQPPLSDN